MHILTSAMRRIIAKEAGKVGTGASLSKGEEGSTRAKVQRLRDMRKGRVEQCVLACVSNTSTQEAERGS